MPRVIGLAVGIPNVVAQLRVAIVNHAPLSNQVQELPIGFITLRSLREGLEPRHTRFVQSL